MNALSPRKSISFGDGLDILAVAKAVEVIFWIPFPNNFSVPNATKIPKDKYKNSVIPRH